MNTVVKQHPLRPEAKETKACKSYWFTIIEKLQAIKCFMIVSVFHLCFRFGRKKVIIGSLILAAVSSIGAVLLTTEDDSNKGKCFIERDSNFVSCFELKQVFLPDWSVYGAFQRQQKWISKPCSLQLVFRALVGKEYIGHEALLSDKDSSSERGLSKCARTVLVLLQEHSLLRSVRRTSVSKAFGFYFQHHNFLSAYIVYVMACMIRILKSILYGYDDFLTLKTSAKSF